MMHGLALQVVVPLIAVPLCLAVRSGRSAAWLASFVALFLLGNSVALLDTVRDGGAIEYFHGGFSAPFGIEYRLDLLNAYVLVVVAAVVAATTVWAAFGSRRELEDTRLDRFFATWLLCVTGSMGILVTGDAFNIFVFLEIASLSGYVLVAQGASRCALVASFRYLLTGTIAATFILIGIGLLYMMTGTLNLQDLAERLPGVADSRAVKTGWAFLSVGLCLKAAVFPLHLWLPGAYAHAPSVVTALLAGTSTKIAIYLWLRLFFTTFSPSLAFVAQPIDRLLLPLGLFGAVAASLVAVYQSTPKLLLAWSSVAQVGYMVIGMSLASATGLSAALAQLASHAVIKAAAFLALGTIALQIGATRRQLGFQDLRGLGRRAPGTAVALTICGLGLIGAPLTSGFVSKWMLVEALLERERWYSVAVVLGTSLLAIVYVFRLVVPMYTAPESETPETRTVAVRPGLAIPLCSLCAVVLWFGVDTRFIVDVAKEAVEQLLGSAR